MTKMLKATFEPEEVIEIQKAFPDAMLEYTKLDDGAVTNFSSATLRVGTVLITKSNMLVGDELQEDVTVAPQNPANISIKHLIAVKNYVYDEEDYKYLISS